MRQTLNIILLGLLIHRTPFDLQQSQPDCVILISCKRAMATYLLN